VAPISGARYPDHLLATVWANAQAFAAIDPQPSLPPLPRLLSQQVHYISSHRPLLEARARQRHVIDAHGDLRPEHLFLVDPPEIIDCIAFNRRFRFLDTASELAFLGLECERAGMGWVMPAFWASYQDVTGDRPPPGLLRFYRKWHACTRAKIALWHLEDDDSDAPRWVGKARRYLQLAAGAAGR
jgi:aminoglycoside phosphotransferase family enzyme